MEMASPKNKPAVQVVAGRIARFFGIRFYDLYYGEKNLLSPPKSAVPSLPSEVRLATPGDLDRIICQVAGDTCTVFDHNNAIDSRCYVAFHEGAIAGYLWVNENVIDLLGMHIADLPPKSSFVHSLMVFPEHRRKGMFQYLFGAACKEMYTAGFHRVTCLVDKANRPAVEAFKHEGMEFHNAPVLKIAGIKPVCFCRALA